MTLKHIKFIDSPVMRELERQAIKKGTFQPQVEEIVKQASLPLKYAASGNIYDDMFVLVKGLRVIGLEQEASSLEDKIILHKQAETHLYRVIDEDGEDLLEFAHPNGNTHIADAKDENGDVETGLSAHNKIIQILNTQPTGKVAKILSNTNYILKKAQETPEVELPDEIALDETQLKKITAINESLSQNWPEIGNQVREAIATCNLQFSADAILKSGENSTYVNFFASKAKVSVAELNSLIRNWNYLYTGAQFAVSSVIQSKLSKLDRSSMYTTVNAIDPNFAKTYFTGINWMAGIPDDIYNNHINEHPEDFKNPNSVFTLEVTGIIELVKGLVNPSNNIKLNSKALAVACEKLQESMTSKYNALITSKITEANKNLQSEVSAILNPLMSLLSGKLSVVPKVKSSSEFIISALTEYLSILNKYLADGDKGKSLNAIFDNMLASGEVNSGVFFQHINEASNTAQGIIEYLSNPENAINAQDLVPSNETYATISNNFLTAARRLNSYVKQLRHNGIDRKSKKFKKYYRILRKAADAYGAVKDVKGKPYSAISGQISGIFPKVTSIDLLLKESDSWLRGTEPLENKTSSANNSRIKLADYPDDSEVEAKSQGGGSAKINTAVKLSPQEKDAVQGMQLALFTLGQYLNTYGSNKVPELSTQIPSLVAALMRTGKGINDKATKNQFDGAWGQNTTGALSAAQTVINSWNSKNSGLNIEQVQIGPMMNQGQKTIGAANNNTVAVNKLIRVTFGNQSAQNQSGTTVNNVEVDGLPQKANLTTTEEPDTTIYDGSGVKLTLSNLRNLSTFYNFLVTSGLETPDQSGVSESSIGYEGFAIRKWNTIIQWFKKRAVFKYNLFGRQDKGMEGYKQNARAYYNAVTNLESQFKYLFTSLLSRTKDKDNFGSYVVSEDVLSQMNQRGFGGNATRSTMLGTRQRGNNYRINTVSNEYSGWQSGISNGRSVSLPPDQSEGSPIGERLNLERLGILDDSIVYPIINFNQFRANAIDLANSLMNESGTGLPAVNKFQQFLVNLYKGIQAAAAEWARSGQATEEEIEASSKWSNAWAQMIRKKMDQIQRWRAAGGK